MGFSLDVVRGDCSLQNILSRWFGAILNSTKHSSELVGKTFAMILSDSFFDSFK